MFISLIINLPHVVDDKSALKLPLVHVAVAVPTNVYPSLQLSVTSELWASDAVSGDRTPFVGVAWFVQSCSVTIINLCCFQNQC